MPSWDPLWLHPKDAEARFLDGRIEARGECESEHATRIDGIDDTIVPEPRGGVIRVALALVLVANRRLEGFLFFLGPRPALRLHAVAFHAGQNGGGLLAAHDGDPRVGPGPDKTRVEGSPAHAVIAGPEGPTQDEREFRYARARNRG